MNIDTQRYQNLSNIIIITVDSITEVPNNITVHNSINMMYLI